MLMIKRSVKRIFLAWMMVLTFITAILVKDIHAHNLSAPHIDKVEQHQATIQAHCYICNFDMCKMDMPKLFVWQAVLWVKRFTQCLFTSQVVYRQPIEINTHSPPFASLLV